MKKVLFTATVDSHILAFHTPYLQYFKDNGYEVHVATNGEGTIPYCDVKHTVTFERSPFKPNNLKAIRQLKKIIDTEQFDIIHTHTPMGSVVTRLAAMQARKKLHTRVIYTAHGFHFFKGAPLQNWLIFYPVEKLLARKTDTLITINKEDYELAKKKFKTDVRFVAGVGIDPKKFDFVMSSADKAALRTALGLKDTDFVMIYPAELSKRKRQMWLIKALKDTLLANPSMHLLLPGKDSLNGQCQALVNELHLEKNVHFLGFRKDIPRLLTISNVAVSAARQEGLPVNIMEAMYLGLPVVATNCRGNADLIKGKANSHLVDANDSFAMAEAVVNVRKSGSERTMSKGNATEYCIANILPLVATIYKDGGT